MLHDHTRQTIHQRSQQRSPKWRIGKNKPVRVQTSKQKLARSLNGVPNMKRNKQREQQTKRAESQEQQKERQHKPQTAQVALGGRLEVCRNRFIGIWFSQQ